MDVNIIVAVGKDGAIGKNGDLIWHIGEDLRRFKALTTGHPVIMGRKTWESLPRKPLPGRLNIVITTDPGYRAPGAVVTTSPEKALEAAGDSDPFIIGGAGIYAQMMKHATRLHLTSINAADAEADTFLEINPEEWEVVEMSEEKISPEGVGFRFLECVKRNS